MARIKNGILGPITGKLANLVGYERFGQAVIRMLPKKSKKKKKRTDGQIAVNLRFKLVKSFISVVNEFTNAGFKLAVKETTWIAQNAAVSYNLKQAVTGEYPNFELDYSKITLSKGLLPAPENPAVEFNGDLLKFKWDVDAQWDYIRKRDQVMMLAYLPANKNAYFSLSGARRSAGEDVLQVQIVEQNNAGPYEKNDFIETYIAFISDDRESISDSIYVGRIIL